MVRVATPVISPGTGTYDTAISVMILCDEPGAIVRYTENGTIPTINSLQYKAPIPVSQDKRISAIAFKDGMQESFVNSKTYTIGKTPNPAPNPEPQPNPNPLPPNPSADIKITARVNERKAISPYIFGTNLYQDTDNHPAWSRCGRIGGNLWTPYNWKNNASNAGNDWQHFNTPFLGGGDDEGMAAGIRVEKIHAKKAAALVTIPINSLVAADKELTDVTKTPEHLKTRFKRSLMDGDRSDKSSVYQAEFLIWLVHKFGYNDMFYALDNEPDLWSKTHSAIYPMASTYDEYLQKAISAARTIRSIVGHGRIFGPVLSGYYGIMCLGNEAERSKGDFVSYFLKEMKKASDSDGKRLLDVLDVHWYPEHKGENGIAILNDDTSPETCRARVQAPRSLWDSTFKENSWIANDVLRGPIQLIPDLQAKIDANYPGTGLAFTEYYYGGGNHISGAIAQADVLGIFAKYGVFAANLWHLGNTDDSYTHAAFQCFEKFGAEIFGIENSNPVDCSVYVGTGATVLINKAEGLRRIELNLGNGRAFMYPFLMDASAPTLRQLEQINAALPGVFYYDAPPMSITVFY